MSFDRIPAAFPTAQSHRISKVTQLIDQIVTFLLILLILFSPLPFGSVQASSLLFAEIMACICFVLWCVKLAICEPGRLSYRSSRQKVSLLHLSSFARFIKSGKSK